MPRTPEASKSTDYAGDSVDGVSLGYFDRLDDVEITQEQRANVMDVQTTITQDRGALSSSERLGPRTRRTQLRRYPSGGCTKDF